MRRRRVACCIEADEDRRELRRQRGADHAALWNATGAGQRHLLEHAHLDQVRDELQSIRPMAGAFYPEYVRRLNGTHVKQAANKWEMVELLREDIRTFMRANDCARAVAVWCGSTEVWASPNGVH